MEGGHQCQQDGAIDCQKSLGANSRVPANTDEETAKW